MFLVEEILTLRFKVAIFHPLHDRAYREMPEFLANIHAIVNGQNQDNRCIGSAFLTMITSYGHGEHDYRPQVNNHLFNKRRLKQITYPVAIQDIPAVENTIRMNINVFSF